MENTSRETAEDPVLLSWEMPARRRRLFVTLFWLLIVPFGLAVVIQAFYIATGNTSDERLERLFSPVSPWVLLFVWLSAFIACMPVYAGAVRLDCRSSGIAFTMLLTGRRYVRWDEIVRLSRNRLGYTILQYGDAGRDYVRLLLPPDVRDGLIAILRETSNARIIGFGPEGS